MLLPVGSRVGHILSLRLILIIELNRLRGLTWLGGREGLGSGQ